MHMVAEAGGAPELNKIIERQGVATQSNTEPLGLFWFLQASGQRIQKEVGNRDVRV